MTGRSFVEDSARGGIEAMEPYLAQKLAGELERYQDRDFLKAAMAAFVLTAHADGSMGSLERLRIDETLKTEPGLKEFDFQKATEILDSYAKALRGPPHGRQLQAGADPHARLLSRRSSRRQDR
jgi:tellurite resistance protein